jgi:hypothetical protein
MIEINESELVLSSLHKDMSYFDVLRDGGDDCFAVEGDIVVFVGDAYDFHDMKGLCFSS